MTALVVLQSVVLVVLVVLVSGLLRSHATILRRLHELGAGTEAPPTSRPPPAQPAPGPTAGRPASLPAHDISGLGLDDGAVAVRVVEVEHDTILVFLSSGCSTCGAFWEALGQPDLALPQGTRLVLVTQGPDREHVTLVAELAPTHVPLILSNEAWHDYAVPGSPYVVLVDGPSGRVVGEGTAPTFEQVLSMLGRAVDDAAHRSRLASHRGEKAKADAAREAEIDDALIVAGVRPGDPSLYRSVDQPSAPDEGGSAVTSVVALGVVLAALAAVRSTWSP